jgi:hypothetical protein
MFPQVSGFRFAARPNSSACRKFHEVRLFAVAVPQNVQSAVFVHKMSTKQSERDGRAL